MGRLSTTECTYLPTLYMNLLSNVWVIVLLQGVDRVSARAILQQREGRQKQGGWGANGRSRYTESRGVREGVCTVARRRRKCFFNFCALLAARFSLRRRLTGQRGRQCYVPISVTVLTA